MSGDHRPQTANPCRLQGSVRDKFSLHAGRIGMENFEPKIDQ